MNGISITVAPCFRSNSLSAEACLAARPTTIRFPASGFMAAPASGAAVRRWNPVSLARRLPRIASRPSPLRFCGSASGHCRSRNTLVPSGEATTAVSDNSSPAASACAPIGTWQPPPKPFNSARSQAVVARDAASSMKEMPRRIPSPLRTSTAKRSLPRSRTHLLERQPLAHHLFSSQSFQSSRRQNDRFEFAALQLAQTRVHIPAQRKHLRDQAAWARSAPRAEGYSSPRALLRQKAKRIEVLRYERRHVHLPCRIAAKSEFRRNSVGKSFRLCTASRFGFSTTLLQSPW